MGSTNLAWGKKVNLQVLVRLSFQVLSSFFGKVAKMHILLSILYILIFAPQSLIASLQHIKLCISLLSQSLLTLGIA